MEVSQLFNSDSFTGRQAATIIFVWLFLVLTASVSLLLITRMLMG